MNETRVQRILGELARHPEGLSTPQIADICEPDIQSRQQAQTRCGEVLRRYAKAGLVRQGGFIPGGHQRAPAVVWQLAIPVPGQRPPAPPSGVYADHPKPCAHRMMEAVLAEMPPPGAKVTEAELTAWYAIFVAVVKAVYGPFDLTSDEPAA
jgi:hypothetical protein